MIKYFKFHLLERKNFLIVSSLLCILACASGLGFMNFIYEINGTKRPMNAPLNFIATIIFFMAILVPMFEFSFKMRKVSVDEYYQLPIKKKKLFAIHYLVGIIEIIIPTIASAIASFLIIFFKENLFDFGPYFLYLLFGLIIGIAIYTIFAFAFTRGNTTVDGIIFMFMYIFIFFVILVGLQFFLKKEELEIYRGILPVSLFDITEIFNNLMCKYDVNITPTKIAYPIALIVIAIALGILFIILNDKDPAENTSQVSQSYFGYITLIPIIGAVFGAMLLSLSLLYLPAIILYSFLAYLIFNRGIHFNKKQLISMACELVFMIILTIVILCNGGLFTW